MEISEMAADRDQSDDLSDDMARLIHEVLTDLGTEADAAEIARRVRGLDRGLPAEDDRVPGRGVARSVPVSVRG
jgi:hypothetical protein